MTAWSPCLRWVVAQSVTVRGHDRKTHGARKWRGRQGEDRTFTSLSQAHSQWPTSLPRRSLLQVFLPPKMSTEDTQNLWQNKAFSGHVSSSIAKRNCKYCFMVCHLPIVFSMLFISLDFERKISFSFLRKLIANDINTLGNNTTDFPFLNLVFSTHFIVSLEFIDTFLYHLIYLFLLLQIQTWAFCLLYLQVIVFARSMTVS